MSKANLSNIAAAMAQHAKSAPLSAVASPADAHPSTQNKPVKQSSRVGKVQVNAWLAPDFKKSLRLVQNQTGEDVQTIIARALNEIFRAHNVPVIDS